MTLIVSEGVFVCLMFCKGEKSRPLVSISLGCFTIKVGLEECCVRVLMLSEGLEIFIKGQ